MCACFGRRTFYFLGEKKMKKRTFQNWGLLINIIISMLLVACVHEHSYGEWTTEKAATCTENGIKIRMCECGEKQTETIVASGHTVGEWIVDTEATCAENGAKHQICATCSATIKTEQISATGQHNYTSEVTAVATCAENGVRTYTCSICNHSYTETIKATDEHSYKSKVTTAATCADNGVRTYTCSICNHSYTETIKATDEHSYKSKVTTAATCAENGVRTYTCSICNHSYTETIKATGKHSYVDGVCSSCGENDPDLLFENLVVIDSSRYYIGKQYSITDTYGNVHSPSFVFYKTGDNGTRKDFSVYNLNRKYTSFSGSFVCGLENTTRKSLTVNIYVDGELVFSKGDITRTTEKVDFKVNVNNALNLMIEIHWDAANLFGYHGQIALVNPKLTK